MLASIEIDNPVAVVEISNRIRDSFHQASILDGITDEALTAYRQMEGGAVAVRSSVTAEDLPEAAFAGQQGTFKNIIGEKPLLNAVLN